jgi:hypothetical protein
MAVAPMATDLVSLRENMVDTFRRLLILGVRLCHTMRDRAKGRLRGTREIPVNGRRTELSLTIQRDALRH